MNNSDDIKLIEDEEELAKAVQDSAIAQEMDKDAHMSEKHKQIVEGTVHRHEYDGEIDAPLIPKEQILAHLEQ